MIIRRIEEIFRIFTDAYPRRHKGFKKPSHIFPCDNLPRYPFVFSRNEKTYDATGLGNA